MRKFWITISLIVTFIVLISCGDNNQQIRTWTSKIDSLEQISSCPDDNCFEQVNNLIANYVDSIYSLEPNNYFALISKAINHYNNGNETLATPLFRKVLEHDSVNLIHHGIALTAIGIQQEVDGQLEQSKETYNKILPIINQSTFAPWMEPQIITVIEGKEAGLESLDQVATDTASLLYLYLKNDITNYENDGLRYFFPTNSRAVDPSVFSIVIPEDLYNSKALNNIDKVGLFYARKGVNVHVIGHYRPERRFEIQTTEKYIKPLLAVDDFQLVQQN